MSRTLASDVIDAIAPKGTLDAYRFLSTTGTATIKGFFVDHLGHQVGSSFTNTVDASEAKTFVDLSGAALNENAVGFRGVFTVACYYSLLPGSETDFETNPTNYPQIPAGNDVHIGRVAL